VALALLVAADALFLWMFLATDPLEQVAAHPRGMPQWLARDAMRFAAAWRHGMSGNSWVYMPGFFATAAAIWLHARRAPIRWANAERLAAGFAALAIAVGTAGAGSDLVLRAYADASGARLAPPVPGISAGGLFQAGYTLLTWSVFVLACRQALSRRTFRPFIAPAILTVGLALIRPWTVDDFTADWAAGVAGGETAALVSFVLVFLVAALLAISERRSPEPQPGEASLRGGTPARAEHEEDVGREGDHVKAG
jgi:hypothetical protein